ncbi:dipeptidyl carboxypeptidase II, partial [Serratia rubidaea]|nr:dipeptidyl carboxypeptidase II [Serratia rubidaea]
MRLSTLVLAMSMALGTQAQAEESKTTSEHAALPSGQAKEATVTGEANQHENQKSDNPFFYQSRLPYQAPPFDRIKESDYAPAIEEGIKQKLAEVEKIANNPAKADFDNTLVALEKTGALLTRVMSVFGAMTSANTSDALQKLDEEVSPKLAAMDDAIMLNSKLFARIKAVYEQRDALKLDAESRRLLEVAYQSFELAGANLSDADKTKLKALNQEAATLSTQFTNKLLAAAKNGALAIHRLNTRKQLAVEHN